MNFPVIDVFDHPHYGDSVRYENYVELQEVAEKLEARHTALREAVAWERECEQLDFWGVAYALCRRHPGNYIDTVRADFYAIRDSARAEVDLLIANEGAANCEGEG